MKSCYSALAIIIIVSASFLLLSENSAAQNKLTPGSYQLVGSMRNGTGFDGVVTIDEQQAAGLAKVQVSLRGGYLLQGAIDEGNFKVEEARRGRSRIKANGTVSMLGPDHAVGQITVRGQGRGIMMLGRLR